MSQVYQFRRAQSRMKQTEIIKLAGEFFGTYLSSNRPDNVMNFIFDSDQDSLSSAGSNIREFEVAAEAFRK